MKLKNTLGLAIMALTPRNKTLDAFLVGRFDAPVEPFRLPQPYVRTQLHTGLLYSSTGKPVPKEDCPCSTCVNHFSIKE